MSHLQSNSQRGYNGNQVRSKLAGIGARRDGDVSGGWPARVEGEDEMFEVGACTYLPAAHHVHVVNVDLVGEHGAPGTPQVVVTVDDVAWQVQRVSCRHLDTALLLTSEDNIN
jgi:hypothetical protein